MREKRYVLETKEVQWKKRNKTSAREYSPRKKSTLGVSDQI